MSATILQGDCLEKLRELDAGSVHCVVTSPPYWGLRDYGVEGQLGLEASPDEYLERMVEVFSEVRRVLRADGTCWVNMGDCYWSRPNGSVGAAKLRGSRRNAAEYRRTNAIRKNRQRHSYIKHKDLIGMPWRLAFALQADGWWLRKDIMWSKPNPMPESVTDRPTTSHEYVFLLTKSSRYFYDGDAVREPHTMRPQARPNGHKRRRTGPRIPEHTWSGTARDAAGLDGNPSGRNLRDVWTITTEPYAEAHFATFPRKLVEPCVKAGCPEGGTVLDPFAGTGTVGVVAHLCGCNSILIELNPEYVALMRKRVEPVVRQPLIFSPGAA